MVLLLLAMNLRFHPPGGVLQEEDVDIQPGVDEHNKEFKDVDVKFSFGEGCIALGLGSVDWPT